MRQESRQWYSKPDVVLREESDDWAILFDPDTGQSLVLNPVAVCMFKALQETGTVSGIARYVRERYKDIPDALDSDIEALVEGLAEKGFIGQAAQ